MHKAALCALVLHVLLLAIIPKIPNWDLPFIESGLRLNVTLTKDDDTFEQSLNYPNNTAQDSVSQTSRLNVAAQSPGENDSTTNESQAIAGSNADPVESNAIGQNDQNKSSPRIVYGYSSILKFAQQEAVRYAQSNPDDLARFSRSFNSRKQYQRRKRTNSYKNQYGDQYVDKGSSNGDICFVKTDNKNAGPAGTFDAGTYTVHFFRCKDKQRSKVPLI